MTCGDACDTDRPSMRRETVTSFGMDVAETRKGLDLVALDVERNIVATEGRRKVTEVVAMVHALRSAVVCIDAPIPSACSS
jgi:hypothetical protein